MDFLGGLVSGAASYFGAQNANKTNARIAQQQMGFQADQSATAYQRSMADMRAAGLNPMLAYSQGGASSGAGASYVAQNELSGAVSSAADYRRLSAELKNMEVQNDSIKSQIALNEALKAKALEDAKLSQASAKNVLTNEKLSALNVPAASNKAKVESTLFGSAMSFINKLRGR